MENPALARPAVVIGGPWAPQETIIGYIERHGKEYTPAPRPPGVARGAYKACYMNATRLMLENDDLDYIEGIAYLPGGGDIGFLHAWAAGPDGRVVDNTWDDPEACRYYGVRYGRAAYLALMLRTKVYGVLGGENRAALEVLANDGLGLRSEE